MSFGIVLLVATLLLTVNGISIPTTRIQVDNVNHLSLSDHSSIFNSIHYTSSTKKTAHHNVHIFDKFGQFIKLSSSSSYEDHIEIFELHPTRTDGLQSMECFTDDTNSIHIKFDSKHSAQKHHKLILNHQKRHQNNEYFVTAPNHWKCYNSKEKQNTPILRVILTATIDTNKDASLLIITTQYASYTDIFNNLQLSLKTNAHFAHIRGFDTAANEMQSQRRRLIWDYKRLWSDVVEGVQQLWDDVGGSIDEMKQYIHDFHFNGTTKYFVDTLMFGRAAQHLNDTQIWAYNYNKSSAKSKAILPLTANIACVDCYAYGNLTYVIDLEINNYKLAYYKMIAMGNIKLNADIQSRESYHGEFRLRIPKELQQEPISFTIAGIVPVTLRVNGEFAIGVDSETPFSKTLSTTGEIVRGVEYNASRNLQKYIAQQSFDRKVIGPILDSNANYAHVYQRLTLYLSMSFMGDIYLGAKSDAAVSIAEAQEKGCVVGYTPSATVTAFVGANISVSGWKIWNKTDNIEVYTLAAGSAGCITHAAITAMETWEMHEIIEINDTEDASSQDNNGLPQVYINYTEPQTAYMFQGKWGKKNTIWHANVSALNGTCWDPDDESPDSAFLMIYPLDNNGDELHGVYKTSKHVSIEDGYAITTDVHCIARYEFERSLSYSNSRRYNGALMDFDIKCDVEAAVLMVDDDWFTQFSLPSMMDAVLLDSSFNTILFHDSDNCFVFPLTKNTDFAAFTFDKNTLEMFHNKSYKWPSRTWFGSFSCAQDECVNALKVYFTDINWLSGDINCTFLMDNNETWIADGHLSFDTLTLLMDIYRSDGSILQANGFITVLDDGTMIYSGVFPGDRGEKEYMAFVFAGYLNMQQFADEQSKVFVVKEEVDTKGKVTDIHGISLVAWVLIISACILVLCSVVYCVRTCVKKHRDNESQGSYFGMMDDRYL